MTTPTGLPGPASPAGPRPGRAGWPGASMRVSDAERAMIADRLAMHFGDGRLDQAEFEDRLDRALRAKTRADLIGLLSDLPEGLPAASVDPERSRRQRRREWQLLKVQLERERLLLAHDRRETRRQERELRRQSLHHLPTVVALVVIVLVVATVLRHLYSLWLVLAALAFLWLRYGHRGPGSDD